MRCSGHGNRIFWNVIADRRSRTNNGSITHLHGCNKCRVRTNEGLSTNFCTILLKAIVIAGDRARTDQSFLVPKDEIASNDYDLSINRYKEVVYEEVQYDPPKEIVQNLKNLEKEIDEGLKELEGMLG